jgi:hypothetical protein
MTSCSQTVTPVSEPCNHNVNVFCTTGFTVSILGHSLSLIRTSITSLYISVLYVNTHMSGVYCLSRESPIRIGFVTPCTRSYS